MQAAIEWQAGIVVVVTERLPFTTFALAERFPVVLDIVDSMTMHMSERAARSWPPIRWFWQFEADRFTKMALPLGQAARAVIASSGSARIQYPRAIIVPNAASFGSRPRPTPVYDIAFTGNLWYWPNVDAARIVCEEIVPWVRRRLPATRVVIAGRNPTTQVRRMSRRANVTLMANVPDLGSLLASCRIAVAPIQWTPGANLKILDAIAVGTPVLTFQAAAAELPAGLSGVVTCESSHEMALIATDFLSGERDLVPAHAASGWRDRANALAEIINELHERAYNLSHPDGATS
ncbi:MAG: glycosyltransferase [Candidatus Dormibacteraceae bacterium]